MVILVSVETILSYIFLGLAAGALLVAFIIRLMKRRHAADIAELFAVAFFLAYVVQVFFTSVTSAFNILFLSLGIILAIYKIIFFVKGK